MKIVNSLLVAFIVNILISCGPAAEDRKLSDERNKIIQDSLTNSIKSRMAEPLQIINEPVQPAVQPTAVATPTVK